MSRSRIYPVAATACRFAAASFAGLLMTAFVGPAAAQPEVLRVGLTTSAPFGGSQPGGYCFDLMNTIADRSGLRFQFQTMVTGELIPTLLASNIDIICSANGATNERRAMGIAFTSGIAMNSEALLVLANDTTAYLQLAELRGQPVGAPAGTLFVGMLRDAGVTNIIEKAGAEVYAALVAGEVKAVLTSAPTIRYQQQVLGLWPELRLVETYVSTNPIYSAIAVRNTEVELLGVLQASLEALKADGTLPGLLDAWAIPPPLF